MQGRVLVQADEMSRILERLVSQIIETHGACKEVMLVGIQRRGVDIAKRLQSILENRLETKIGFGSLDINLYRDDWTSLDATPYIGQSNIENDVDNQNIILVDDVLYSGRTIRAALEALLDYGRPKRVELLVLIDRGHRELPIEAKYVGRNISTRKDEHINVLINERDGKDEVQLI